MAVTVAIVVYLAEVIAMVVAKQPKRRNLDGGKFAAALHWVIEQCQVSCRRYRHDES